MEMRIGVFVDVSNLYYCIGKKFGTNKKLDYKKYYEWAESKGNIMQAIAYGAQLENEATGFIHCLKLSGYSPKFKRPKQFQTSTEKEARKADWDVGIAIDIVSMIDRLDTVILGTADGDLEPVVKWARDRGVTVIVMACGISRDLKNIANEYIEIPESMLVEVDVTG